MPLLMIPWYYRPSDVVGDGRMCGVAAVGWRRSGGKRAGGWLCGIGAGVAANGNAS